MNESVIVQWMENLTFFTDKNPQTGYVLINLI